MQRYLLATVLALLVGLGLAAPSIADEDEVFESKRLETIKVSLGQAIEIAERDNKGKVVKVEFDIEHNHAAWEIKIFTGTQFALLAPNINVAKQSNPNCLAC